MITPAGEIPGYALVETINVKETGDVIHVFKRTANGRPQKEDLQMEAHSLHLNQVLQQDLQQTQQVR